MFKKSFLLLFFSAIILLWGCGKSGDNDPADKQNKEDQTDKDKDQKTGIKSLDKFVDNMKDVQKQFENSKEVEVVDFRSLKEMMPEETGGLPRTSLTGEKNSGMGFKVSQAEAEYNTTDPDQSKNIRIKIVDMGNMAGFAGLAAFGWMMAEVDRETDTGYERTIDYKGQKGYEKYDNESLSGSLEVFVDKRFMVSVDGYNVSMDAIHDAMDEVDYDKLQVMKESSETAE